MDLLSDFGKHQLKTALPGLLQNTTLCTLTHSSSKRKTPPSANTTTLRFTSRFSYREMCRPSKL